MDENGLKYETFHNEIKRGNWDGKEFIQTYLGKNNTIMNASSAIFNKDIALTIDPQYKSFKGSGDWLFWIEIIQKGSVSYIDEALNFFRKHGSNTTEKSYANGTDFIEDKRIFDYLVKNRLINSSTIKNVRRHNLVKFTSFPFDSEEIRNQVIKTWNFSTKERLRMQISQLLHRLRNIY